MSSDAVQIPQPQAILRGHKAQVHAASFIRGNDRLATGDADGFVVLWDLTIMRPRAVWQAHTNAILGIAGWGSERIITHGRDNRLVVWKVGAEDEGSLSTSLPLDVTSDVRPQPGIVHKLEVNTMNFCSFASCAPLGVEQSSDELLVAVPNTLASEAIDIFHLPSQLRRHTVKLGDKNGMVMALAIFYLGSILTIAAGYENGLATVAQLDDRGTWVVKYRAQCHSQPILSLDIAPDLHYFVTASADAIVAKHPLPPHNIEAEPDAAPDSQPNANEQESGSAEPSEEGKPKSLLSAALAAQSSRPQSTIQESDNTQIQTQPLRVVNTKHAGQQGLRIRSDGKIFATAGWDAKVRVYSTKTSREVAVLKWHQVGCYAVAFSNLQATNGSEAGATISRERTEKASTVVPRLLDMTVKERRIQQATTAHWLAAGSKDGKVSLWDVF